MAAHLSQRATQRQSLGLTPALQQSVKLLELSNAALAELIGEVLAENPLLEWAEEPPSKAPVRQRPVRPASAPRPLPAGLARVFSVAPRRGKELQSAATAPAMAASGPSLQEYMQQQLGADIAGATERAIGRALIESVDAAGYLTEETGEIARRLGEPLSRVERVLRRLQQFDPPGVFARDLAECLALQLADRGHLDVPMRALLGHLDLLAEGNRTALRQHCDVDDATLDAMLAVLRRLDPRPGLAFDTESVPMVVPDLTIEPTPGGGWQIELTGEPRIALHAGYSFPPASDHAASRYLRERQAEARWLLRALDRRSETLLQVAHEIVARQRAFLESGSAGLVPLSRREIATRLDLHESTVGRAIAGKYAATPRGVIALADFFAGKLVSGSEAPGHAPGAVRQRLKRLIAGEPAGRPISDERLARLLRDEGIAIARRTVAKYREMLRIPPSARRRRNKTLQSTKAAPR